MGIATEEARTESTTPFVNYQTQSDRYRHWRLSFDGPIATLTMDVQEDGGLRPGYTLKLNSYDLGVDIELYDALQRIRFEHRARSYLLFRCQHFHVGTVLTCLESQFL